MSYLVLARKWRPQTFADVIGQQPVLRTLQNALKRNRVAHAMLFSGVRGVGKTTLARLMAKALNCRAGEPDAPCNRCEACREIMAGTAVDLHEIDGASNRGIQEIRELKENIRFFPVRDRYKIIIIDEVHMLTTEAFNALLKTLEEPPAHVYFMFATTELHKIPITILSRCQRYELKRVPFAELVDFFKKIAAEEKVAISEHALGMIAGEAGGSVRDGLSLLDQIFSFGGETVTDEDVTEVLGLVDREILAALSRALLAGDLARVIDVFEKGYSFGIDLKRFANDLLAYYRSLLICKIMPRSEDLLDLPDQELATLSEIVASSGVETLYRQFHLLLKGIEEMQYSSRPRMVLEMTFIRAAQSGQVVPVSELIGRLDGFLQGSGLPPAASSVEVRQVSPMPAVAPVSPAEPEPPAPSQERSGPVRRETVGNQEGSSSPVEEGPADSGVGRPSPKDVRKNWEEFIRYVKERKQWMAQVLHLCSSFKEQGADLVLKYGDPSDCKMLQESGNTKLLTEFFQDFFQKELKIVFQVRGGGAEINSGDEDGPQEERRALTNDPLVRMTTEIFGGQVAAIRTGPRSRQ